MLGLLAHGGQIGHQSDIPEHGGDGGVGRNREHVPHQRTAELRPHSHAAGIGEHPVGQPGTAHVQQREHAGAGHGEQRHGFREAVDGIAPGLLEQQQNGGDQRAGVADTDPPHEVDDGEAPRHRNLDTPNADAHQEQVSDGRHQHAQQRHADKQAEQPAQADGARQDRIGNGVSYAAERLPRRHHRWFVRPGHVLQNRFFFWSLLHR